MKRCIIILEYNDSEGFVNIEADGFVEEEHHLKTYKDGELLGVFAKSVIKAAYVTEQPTGKNRG